MKRDDDVCRNVGDSKEVGFHIVRVTLAIMIDKVPATHVASTKLPYTLSGSWRWAETLAWRYTEAPKSCGKQCVNKSMNTPRVSAGSDG